MTLPAKIYLPSGKALLTAAVSSSGKECVQADSCCCTPACSVPRPDGLFYRNYHVIASMCYIGASIEATYICLSGIALTPCITCGDRKVTLYLTSLQTLLDSQDFAGTVWSQTIGTATYYATDDTTCSTPTGSSAVVATLTLTADTGTPHNLQSARLVVATADGLITVYDSRDILAADFTCTGATSARIDNVVADTQLCLAAHGGTATIGLYMAYDCQPCADKCFSTTASVIVYFGDVTVTADGEALTGWKTAFDAIAANLTGKRLVFTLGWDGYGRRCLTNELSTCSDAGKAGNPNDFCIAEQPDKYPYRETISLYACDGADEAAAYGCGATNYWRFAFQGVPTGSESYLAPYECVNYTMDDLGHCINSSKPVYLNIPVSIYIDGNYCTTNTDPDTMDDTPCVPSTDGNPFP